MLRLETKNLQTVKEILEKKIKKANKRTNKVNLAALTLHNGDVCVSRLVLISSWAW